MTKSRCCSARVSQAQAVASALQAKLDKMTLRSPIAGIVASRWVHPGEAVVAGAPLLTVSGLDPVTLRFYVQEADLGRVYLGQEIGLRVDSFPKRRFPGTVTSIAQRAEFTPKNVQTEQDRMDMVFEVRVQVPNPRGLLKPGMPAEAILLGA